MIKALIFLSIFCVVIFIFLKAGKINKRVTYIFVLFFTFLFIFLMIMFLNPNKKQSELNYNPPVYDGTKIIPGHFHEKN